MIVISKNTEKRFLKDINYSYKHTPKQKCLRIALSSIPNFDDKLHEEFLTSLHDLPESYRAQVYLFSDKDILILMFDFMQRQFIEAIKELGSNNQLPSILDQVTIFEICNQYDILQSISLDKINVIKQKKLSSEEKTRRLAAENYTTKSLSKIDTLELATLTTRRLERKNKIIHIIDDDQLSRMLVENVLRHDYTLKFSKNGQEALLDYVTYAPDIVFLDIGLPDIDGHEILEALSQIDPEHYVIMFSGRKDKANLLKAIRLGAQGFVGKPFTRSKLKAYIEKSPAAKLQDTKASHNLATT